MNIIEILEQEHEQVERELLELESIIKDSEENGQAINYPNLIHVCSKLINIWDKHEKKEEIIFPVIKKEQIIIPVKTMLFDHRKLRPHKDAMKKAIDSGSEFKVKQALRDHLPIVLKELREHINYEDEVLYRITLDLFTPEELKQMNID